jgi:hypothetical protein
LDGGSSQRPVLTKKYQIEEWCIKTDKPRKPRNPSIVCKRLAGKLITQVRVKIEVLIKAINIKNIKGIILTGCIFNLPIINIVMLIFAVVNDGEAVKEFV